MVQTVLFRATGALKTNTGTKPRIVADGYRSLPLRGGAREAGGGFLALSGQNPERYRYQLHQAKAYLPRHFSLRITGIVTTTGVAVATTEQTEQISPEKH